MSSISIRNPLFIINSCLNSQIHPPFGISNPPSNPVRTLPSTVSTSENCQDFPLRMKISQFIARSYHNFIIYPRYLGIRIPFAVNFCQNSHGFILHSRDNSPIDLRFPCEFHHPWTGSQHVRSRKGVKSSAKGEQQRAIKKRCGMKACGSYIYVRRRAWQVQVGSISQEIAVQFGKRARRAFYACETRTTWLCTLWLHNVPGVPQKHARVAGYLRGNRLAASSIRGCRNAAAIAPRVNTSRHLTFTSVASRCAVVTRLPLSYLPFAGRTDEGRHRVRSSSFTRFTIELSKLHPKIDPVKIRREAHSMKYDLRDRYNFTRY